MKIHELEPGARFQVTGAPLLIGTVAIHSPSGTTVVYDRQNVVTIDNVVTFTRKERLQISSNTEVTPLPT